MQRGRVEGWSAVRRDNRDEPRRVKKSKRNGIMKCQNRA